MASSRRRTRRIREIRKTNISIRRTSIASVQLLRILIALALLLTTATPTEVILPVGILAALARPCIAQDERTITDVSGTMTGTRVIGLAAAVAVLTIAETDTPVTE